MAFLRVNSCCCGCSLGTGTRIIAIIYLVIYALNFMYQIGLLIAYSRLTLLKIFIQLLVTGFGFLINGTLLHGANSRKSGYLLPWLVITAIGLVLLTIAIPVLIGLATYWSRSQPDMSVVYIIIGVIIFCAISLAISTYLFAVVLSFYHEVKAEQEEGPVHDLSIIPHERMAEERNKQAGNPPVYPDVVTKESV